MKNCERHFLVALVVLIFGHIINPYAAKSQVIEVGGSVGLSYYMGDLNPNKPFNQSRLGFGAVVRYYDNSRWAFRLAYSNLQLDGSDEKANCRLDRGLSFNTKDIPPTIGLIHPDPVCDLNYTPLEAVRRPVRVAVSNSLGFGGHDASVALRKM